jgi:uncharacterized protein with FMN-binding domain
MSTFITTIDKECWEMKKRSKIILWVLLGFVIIIVAMTAWAAIDPIRYRNLVVNDVRLENIPDGLYEGSFKGGRFTNSVEVTIKDHRITDIRKIGTSIPTEKIYKQIYDKVMEKQSLAIDTVSGASVTTRTALKAIENAFSSR